MKLGAQEELQMVVMSWLISMCVF